MVERLSLEDLIPDIGHIRLVFVGVIASALTAAIFAGLAIYVSVGLVLESAGRG